MPAFHFQWEGCLRCWRLLLVLINQPEKKIFKFHSTPCVGLVLVVLSLTCRWSPLKGHKTLKGFTWVTWQGWPVWFWLFLWDASAHPPNSHLAWFCLSCREMKSIRHQPSWELNVRRICFASLPMERKFVFLLNMYLILAAVWWNSNMYKKRECFLQSELALGCGLEAFIPIPLLKRADSPPLSHADVNLK